MRNNAVERLVSCAAAGDAGSLAGLTRMHVDLRVDTVVAKS